MYICMAESLRCSSEAITTLLISYGGGLVAKSCPTLVTPWILSRQAPLSVGFSRQEYWSGLPFHFPFISKAIILKNKAENNKPW